MSLSKQTINVMDSVVSSTFLALDLSLVVVDGPHEGKSLRLEQEVVRLGRGEWCDLPLEDDPWCSSTHCECWLSEQGVRVRDLGSRNGLKINNVRIQDAYLELGSQLQVGQSILELQAHHGKRTVTVSYHDNTQTLLGKTAVMRKIFSMLPKLSKRRVTTFIAGETGVGKTSIARALHMHGDPDSPFVVVNCGALPASLIEDALFGHQKGAFTGADTSKAGYFEMANGGTLFLDEIAELPLELQPKLLDVVERRKVRRLGGTKEIDVNFHLITATHKDLQEETSQGRFREDLFFRLSVFTLDVPPLRERRDDIPLLAEAILKELSPDAPLFLSSRAMQKLRTQIWVGNVRELRNVLERTVTFFDGVAIDAEDIQLDQQASYGEKPSPSTQEAIAAKPVYSSYPSTTHFPAEPIESDDPVLSLFPLKEHNPPLDLKDVIKDIEKRIIQQALDECDAHARDAAKILSLSPSWLYSRISQYGLETKRKK